MLCHRRMQSFKTKRAWLPMQLVMAAEGAAWESAEEKSLALCGRESLLPSGGRRAEESRTRKVRPRQRQQCCSAVCMRDSSTSTMGIRRVVPHLSRTITAPIEQSRSKAACSQQRCHKNQHCEHSSVKNSSAPRKSLPRKNRIVLAVPSANDSLSLSRW